MAALKVRKLWSVFITAFFAVLASLGLTAPAAAGSAAAQPTEPSAKPALEPVAQGSVPETRTPRAGLPRQLPRGRSLPPTIKQRIHAEAHGSSPSVRHLPPELPVGPDAVVAPHAVTAARTAAPEAAAAPVSSVPRQIADRNGEGAPLGEGHAHRAPVGTSRVFAPRESGESAPFVRRGAAATPRDTAATEADRAPAGPRVTAPRDVASQDTPAPGEGSVIALASRHKAKGAETVTVHDESTGGDIALAAA